MGGMIQKPDAEDHAGARLPEKFEVFEQSMLAAEKPKRRRSTPAVKPKDMPEPEKAKPGIRRIVKMEKKTWSGVPMWQCPKCHASVWSEPESRTHTCKEVRFADEEFSD